MSKTTPLRLRLGQADPFFTTIVLMRRRSVHRHQGAAGRCRRKAPAAFLLCFVRHKVKKKRAGVCATKHLSVLKCRHNVGTHPYIPHLALRLTSSSSNAGILMSALLSNHLSRAFGFFEFYFADNTKGGEILNAKLLNCGRIFAAAADGNAGFLITADKFVTAQRLKCEKNDVSQ